MSKNYDMRGAGTGKVQFEMFPQPILDLQRELMHPAHKDLMKHNNSDFVDTIKGICTELEIVLDGLYTGNDLVNLCPMIVDKLIKRRGGLVVISNGMKVK